MWGLFLEIFLCHYWSFPNSKGLAIKWKQVSSYLSRCMMNHSYRRGAAADPQCSLLLIKGRLYKVCGKRAFTFDVCWTPAFTLISGPHQNFGCAFCNLNHINGRGHVRENAGSKENFGKAQQNTFTLGYEAQQNLSTWLHRHYAIFANNKLKRQSVRMAQTDAQSQEPNITRVSDTLLPTFTTLEGEETGRCDEGINENSSDMKQEKFDWVALLCERTHKNGS